MRDFLGVDLDVADRVVYIQHTPTSSNYIKGVVTGFTPCYVKVALVNGSQTAVAPHKLIGVGGPWEKP